jgi:hypothetical protein
MDRASWPGLGSFLPPARKQLDPGTPGSIRAASGRPSRHYPARLATRLVSPVQASRRSDNVSSERSSARPGVVFSSLIHAARPSSVRLATWLSK